MSKSKYSNFTNAIEKPMFEIIRDLERECKVKFVDIERLDTEDSLLQKLSLKNEKNLFPVVSYLITDLKKDEVYATDSLKYEGVEVHNKKNNPVLLNKSEGITLKQIPIQFSIDIIATFVNYEDAYDFLLNMLWLDRKRGITCNFEIEGVVIPSDIYYSPDFDFNSPDVTNISKSKDYMMGLYSAKFSVEVQSLLFKPSVVKAVKTLKIDKLQT